VEFTTVSRIRMLVRGHLGGCRAQSSANTRRCPSVRIDRTQGYQLMPDADEDEHSMFAEHLARGPRRRGALRPAPYRPSVADSQWLLIRYDPPSRTWIATAVAAPPPDAIEVENQQFCEVKTV
jgi:hypothetical protein